MDELRQFLLDRATPGEWALAGEAKTDTNDAEMALEITREKVFRRYHAGAHQLLIDAFLGAGKK